VRKFVLAPLLALEAAVLAALVAISVVAAVREDLTALLYGTIFAALGALAAGAAAWLALGRLPRVPWTAARTAAAAFALLAGATALSASAFAAWELSALWATPDPDVPDGDPCCVHPDTWGDIAESAAWGALFAVAAVGMACAAFASARYAATSRPPRALAEALGGLGILLVLAFVAYLVIQGVVSGDYP